METMYVVRLYDMFDGWMDITGPLTQAQANDEWNKRTANGTIKTKYADGDYYAIFPADTRMVFSVDGLGAA